MTTKFVIVERQNYSGRYVAIRGLSFPTAAEAERTRASWGEWRQKHTFVEERKVKAESDADRMTCQCCGRKIHAATGTIAHHGYERPHEGWQTSSCMGAKHYPFEVSRSQLGVMIVALNDRLEGMRIERHKVATEKRGIMFTYKISSREHKGFEFTRETFESDAGKQVRSEAFMHAHSFDVLLERTLAAKDYEIECMEHSVQTKQNRYNAWKQTHKRLGATWIRI